MPLYTYFIDLPKDRDMPRKLTRVEARDYLKMTDERPLDTFRERECFRHVLGPVAPFNSVLEMFGGAGVFRTLIEELGLLGPQTRHETWDHSQACVDHLSSLFPKSRVVLADSFQQPFPEGLDLISADFNTWTALKYRTDKAYSGATQRLFRSGALWVQLTDSAVNKLHLNGNSYRKAMGSPPSEDRLPPAEYFQLVAQAIRREFGYRMWAVAYHQGAAYYLFHRTAEPPPGAPVPLHVNGRPAQPKKGTAA